MANPPRTSPVFQNTPQIPSCYIFALPNELIVETISWLPHPVHVLYLSYTCKKFHNFLVDPGSAYIWRRVRERFAVIRRVATLSDGGVDPFGHIPKTCWLDMIELPSSKSLMQLLFEAVPIPAPFEDQSEYALARMLFGLKTCTECGKGYHGKPRSFSLPLPFCPECNKKHPSSYSGKHYIQKGDALKDFKKRILSSYPAVGVDAFAILWGTFPMILSQILYTGSEITTLRAPWNRLLAEFVDIVKTGSTPAITEFLKVKMKKLKEKMETVVKHASRLQDWYTVYTHHLQLLGECIKASSRDFATSHGLKFEDMEKAPEYAHALAVANRQYATDIRPILVLNESGVVSQTIKIEANRVAEVTKTAGTTRRDQIEIFYKEFSFLDGVKPTLGTFRTIPILETLQNGISTAEVKSKHEPPQRSYYSHKPFSSRASIYEDLRTPMVQDLTRLAVAQWRESAELGARKLLGFGKPEKGGRKRKSKDKKGGKDQASAMEVDPSEQPPTGDQAPENDGPREERAESSMEPAAPMWHSAPGKLDPEMRITSWFVCVRCTNMDPGYKRMRVLDFRGLCAHECSQKDWGKANAKKWSIDCFNLAPRAIETAKKMLEILGLDAEDSGTTTACLKGWWSCDNCPVWMNAMVWEDLLRHCQRHEHQNISQVSDEETQNRKNNLNFKSKRLSFADLLSGKYEVEARTKQLACVHCRPGSNATSHSKSSKAEKVMDIHGIRQHMKAKHKVEDCRNEDYYYVTDDKVQRPPAKAESAEAIEANA